jgi:hypothetical protein
MNNVHNFVDRRNADRRKANNPGFDFPIAQIPPLSTLEAYSKFGITRNQVASLLINFWHYPDQYRNTLDQYFVRHWEGSHFDKMIKDGTLVQGDNSYLVVYQNCTPFAVKNAKQVKLSFRKPLADLGLQAYVLVKIIDQKESNGN